MEDDLVAGTDPSRGSVAIGASVSIGTGRSTTRQLEAVLRDAMRAAESRMRLELALAKLSRTRICD